MLSICCHLLPYKDLSMQCESSETKLSENDRKCMTVKSEPKSILIFSGKRKSGKDFFTDLLLARLGQDQAVIVKLSAPIKEHWAKTRGLDLSKLLDSSSYKEKYREDMIHWGETMREKDKGYFCRHALEMSQAFEKPIWIVSDARRKTDIQWFKENFKNVKTIRIVADEEVRKKRGWIFTGGVDDASTECDLDNFSPWDIVVVNNGDSTSLEEDLISVIEIIHML